MAAQRLLIRTVSAEVPWAFLKLTTPSLRTQRPYETIDHARAAVGAYIDRYHHRP